MEKSLYSDGYAIFLRQLRAARKRAGLTQVALAEQLGETQSFISKCERGERRIDVVELRTFCQALAITFTAFASTLDAALGAKGARRLKQPRKG